MPIVCIIKEKLLYMINGSFTIIQINGKYLFLKREADGLWDLVGGGYDPSEVKYREVAKREAFEEAGIDLDKDSLELIAILGQQLRKDFIAKYGVKYGYVFIHQAVFYEEHQITLSREHTEYKLFTYEEIISDYKKFKSGPLWMFFTFLAFKDSGKLQEGMLGERRFWHGKEYI